MASQLLHQQQPLLRGKRSYARGNGGQSTHEKNVLVLEADSRIGVEVVKAFLESDTHWNVTATVSSGDKKKHKYARRLGALQVNTCEQNYQAVATCRPDVVVSCITTAKETVHGRNQLFVDAALELGASKFVFMSSIGAGESACALPGPAKETMKPVMSDIYLAEQYLESKSNSIDHLILRCAPLNDLSDDSEVGKPILTESPVAYGWITPAGAAELVLRCLSTSDDTILGKTYSAVDTNTVFVTNPFLRPLESHESMPFEPLPL